jgi:hypothetical protein
MANEKTEGPKTTKKAAAKKTSKPKKAATPKKSSAPKSSSKKPEFGAKSEFIRSQPTSMTAKEVVAAAAAKGIKLSENLVYAARASSRKKNGGASKKTKGPKPVGKKRGPKPKAGSGSKGGSSLEATLRNAIAQVGLARAREIFDEVEKARSRRRSAGADQPTVGGFAVLGSEESAQQFSTLSRAMSVRSMRWPRRPSLGHQDGLWCSS